jgi:hypothetical protein
VTGKVNQYINKNDPVPIATLFHNGKCDPLKLLGLEVPDLRLLAPRKASRFRRVVRIFRSNVQARNHLGRRIHDSRLQADSSKLIARKTQG